MKRLRPGFFRLVSSGAIACFALTGCSQPATGEKFEAVRDANLAAGDLDKSRIDKAVAKLDEKITKLGGTASIEFLEVNSGQVLAARHEHDAKNPASNAKLPTIAAALSVLGPEHRFVTGLYGGVDGTVVHELVLRSHGDPTLWTDDLAGMVRELRTHGVKKVEKILVDQSYFDDHFVPPAFEQQPNEWAYFRAPVAATSLNENTVTIWVRPNKKGDDASISVNPPGYVEIEGTVDTAKKGEEEKLEVEITTKGDKLHAKLGGSVPEGPHLVPIVRRIDDPRRFAGLALRAVLREQGVEATDNVTVGGERETRALVVHSSRPLGEIALLLGKDSNNFVAEMILKAAGAHKGSRASSEEGAKVVTEYLEEKSVNESGVKILNGSGLFDANRITANAMTKLLANSYLDAKVGTEFVGQLSIGGVDGTLKHRFKKWGERRNIRAKTGTLNASIALSGYILAPPGKSPIAFSILVGDVEGKGNASREAIDAAVDAVASELWGAPP